MNNLSIFKSRTKKTQKETPSVEQYYLGLARRTTLVKYLLIMFLVTFTVGSFSIGSDELTIENFNYMLSLLTFTKDSGIAGENTQIVYDTDNSNIGMLFKGDIAVLNGNGLAVYDFTGEKIINPGFKYNNPHIATNGKNILCYDHGGKELRTFNSFSAVSSTSFDYPIIGLNASRSGRYAVITATTGYRSAVQIFNENNEIIQSRMFGDSRAELVSVSYDGKSVLVLSFVPRGGELVYTLSRIEVGMEELSFTYEIPAEDAIQISFFEDGSFAVITSTKLRFFSRDNTFVNEINFEEKSLLGYEFHEKYAIIAYSTAGLADTEEYCVYDTTGRLVRSVVTEGGNFDACTHQDKLYILSRGSVTSFSLTGTEEPSVTAVGSEYKQILSEGERIVLFSINNSILFENS